MSDFRFALPESFRPIVDPRLVAAELSHAHFMHSKIKESDPNYEDYIFLPLSTSDLSYGYAPEEAREIVGGFLKWAFADPAEGVAAKMKLPISRAILIRAANLAENLTGLDIQSVKDIRAEMNRCQTAYMGLYSESMGHLDNIGDQELQSESRSMNSATWILDTLIETDEANRELNRRRIADLMLSKATDNNWKRIF